MKPEQLVPNDPVTSTVRGKLGLIRGVGTLGIHGPQRPQIEEHHAQDKTCNPWYVVRCRPITLMYAVLERQFCKLQTLRILEHR